MRIWHFDPVTGELLGEGLADTSPLEPGRYLIPGNATNQEPPAPQEGKRIIYQDGGWQLQEIPVPPVLTPEEAATAKKEAIKAERDRREAASPFVYAGSSFDYDAKSRERINAAVSAATIAAVSGMATNTVVATWTLYDNTTRDMTIADWLTFRQAEVTRSGALHETARKLKAAVDDALEGGATAAVIDAMPVWE